MGYYPALQDPRGHRGSHSPQTTEIRAQENDLTFTINIGSSRKTSCFLNQKYNCRMVRYLAQGRRVLDWFCHVGRFGFNAAGDATYVRGVDISDITLELAQNKARLNKENGSVDPETPIDFTCADTVDYLPKHAHDRDFPRAESGPFDLISLDPPAFTKSKGSLNHAKKGYEEIDEAAVHLLPCGGYLATCSCSHFTTQELLSEAIQTAAHHMKNVRLRQIELR